MDEGLHTTPNNPPLALMGELPQTYRDGDAHGMQALWRGVITQMLSDAGSNSKKSERISDKEIATRWLFTSANQKDFEMVCDLAGLCPFTVRLKAMRARDRNFAWRNDHRRKH